MPATIKIDRQRRIVSSMFYGNITDAELLAHREALLADPDFSPDFAEIVDFSGASPTFNRAAISALAGRESIFRPHVPHVIVAGADEAYQLARNYQQLARETRPGLYVVRSIIEAQTLLETLGYTL